jgi:hypothetical protein
VNILFIADFFLRDGIRGGAELVDDELTQLLSDAGMQVNMINSHLVEKSVISSQNFDAVMVSNFVNLSHDIKELLAESHNYFIFEHDHKYLKSRDPSTYPNQEAPSSEITNENFYKNAKAVFCQTGMHSRLLMKNILLENVVNLTSSMWSDHEFAAMEAALGCAKDIENVIVDSPNPIKGTAIARAFCEQKGLSYESIPSSSFEDFISKLSRAKNLIFFPTSHESCCRLLVEARMLGCSVMTNDKAGASYEDWFKLSGSELIDYMKEKKKEIAKKVIEVLNSSKEHFIPIVIPKVSIITSVYDGDDHIGGFMSDITSQTIFDRCELIMIDSNSPGNERDVILKYAEKYDNIVYKRLDSDPGIYGAWNEAIEMSTGDILTNANLDDRRARNQIEVMVKALMNNPEIDLVYSFSYRTDTPNETYEKNSSAGRIYQTYNFSKENMVKCLPGEMPLWRKSVHEKCGLFDDSYKSAGDWEMWLRAVDNGSSFKRVDGVHGLYYENPTGLSTSLEKQKDKFEEEKEVFWKYTHVFGTEVTDAFKGYFSK